MKPYHEQYEEHALEEWTGGRHVQVMGNQQRTRRVVGERLAPFTLETLSHGQVRVPADGLVHLQFRRFAGCPVCSLHLRSFAAGIARLDAAGVRTVAFFHSTAASMRSYQGELPFPVVPDPERSWYERFGVERAISGLLHPSAVWAGFRGLVSAASNPLAGEGGVDGLPADFLLDAGGTIRALSYGAHANDQWSLEQVIALASD